VVPEKEMMNITGGRSMYLAIIARVFYAIELLSVQASLEVKA